jgi:hypothetical protein
MRSAVRLLGFAALAVALSPAAYAAHDWTAVGSTAAIDNPSLGQYGFAGAALTFSPGGAAITAHYNVTNTFDEGPNPDQPGWRIFELGYSNFTGGAITSTLFQVDPCTGNQVVLCTINALPNATNICSTCSFTQVIDFSLHLYYIEVRMSRTNSTIFPAVKTLRLF